MRFVKGHGTGNDFVVVPDPDGLLDLTPELVVAICDRRRGIGGDGVLRVVGADASATAGLSRATGTEPAWFMDHRNADGGIAEMCGNGIRVFAQYLIEAGMVASHPSGWITVLTRAGTKRLVRTDAGEIRVDMGPARVTGQEKARIGDSTYEGTVVDVGNPHLVCPIESSTDSVDLSSPPDLDPGVFPAGGNVEIVRSLAPGHLRMRVYERGVGETLACGTGAVAAAAATTCGKGTKGAESRGSCRVEVPGGPLTVDFDGRTTYLSGPASLVAEGELRLPNCPE